MLSFLKNTKDSVTTELCTNFDEIPQLQEEFQVIQNISSIITQIKIARDILFNSIDNMFTITELDRQNDTVLDTLIFVLWGAAANRGDLGLSGINLGAKNPYLFIDKFDYLPPIYKQYFDSLQKYFKVVLEDFFGLRAKIDEFEKLRSIYSDMTDKVKEKVKDGKIGIFERVGIATKALSNVGKLKINSEALTKIELRVIKEIYMAKVIIANASALLKSCMDIGVRMRQECQGNMILPKEGKKYYSVALQVVKNNVNSAAYFVENSFK